MPINDPLLDPVDARLVEVEIRRDCTYVCRPFCLAVQDLVVRPWLRCHIPLSEPDAKISRIRVSDKTSRICFGV
jgi:hypothetical protein